MSKKETGKRFEAIPGLLYIQQRYGLNVTNYSMNNLKCLKK